MLFRPRVVKHGLLLGVVAAIGLGLAATLDARRNPRLRDPSTFEPVAAEGSVLARDALRHAVETLRSGRACACRAPSRR